METSNSKCYNCGHDISQHDEKDCYGGEDLICKCDSFVEPEEEK